MLGAGKLQARQAEAGQSPQQTPAARTHGAAHVEQATSRRQLNAQALGRHIIGPPLRVCPQPGLFCPQPGLFCPQPGLFSCPPLSVRQQQCLFCGLLSGCRPEIRQLSILLQPYDLQLQVALFAGRQPTPLAPWGGAAPRLPQRRKPGRGLAP